MTQIEIRNVTRKDIEDKSRLAGKSTDLIALLINAKKKHNLHAGPQRQVLGLNSDGATILYENGEIKPEWDAVILSRFPKDGSEIIHRLYIRDNTLGVGTYNRLD